MICVCTHVYLNVRDDIELYSLYVNSVNMGLAVCLCMYKRLEHLERFVVLDFFLIGICRITINYIIKKKHDSDKYANRRSTFTIDLDNIYR